MFLEVYAINLSNYNEDTAASIAPENLRLIEMTGVRIRHSDQFPDRAEVLLPNGDVLLAAGSYDVLVERLGQAVNGIARISKDWR